MNKRLPLLLSLLAVILLAASVAYWIMQLVQPPQRPIAAPPLAAMPDPTIDAAATLFGGQIATASAASYQLTGIVSAGRDSVAIIVAEGSPPKALKVGRELAPGISLSEVHPRYVMLSDGGVMKRLELATDAKGAAPMGGPGGAGGMAQQPVNAGMPAAPASGAVQAPPMSPGAVSQQQPPQQDIANPGDVGSHDAPPPQAPGSAANNPNNPPPQPAQMPPPTRATGSPVNQNPATQ
jgi:general secretion pathway protein C